MGGSHTRNSKNGRLGNKPEWLKIRLNPKESFYFTRNKLKALGLNTVCQEAHCPNIVKCWNNKTATFLVLGDKCTRVCRFCASESGRADKLDPKEPEKLKIAVEKLGLKYVVLTSVTRDDLPDFGSNHFGRCIRAIRELGVLVEALIPDFSGELGFLENVLRAEPNVVCHNIETVKRLQGEVRDPRFSYETSLKILKASKDSYFITKSSLMVGLGETKEEIFDAMQDLRRAGVDILTIGQYLRPSPNHLEVKRYVTPEEFSEYEKAGLKMGFKYVAASPFVRSSYNAEKAYEKVMEVSF